MLLDGNSGGFPGGSEVKNLLAMQETQETWVQSLGWKMPQSNPLQYSCLENPMDRGGWQVIVHRIAKSQAQLK